jgi:hypothetical protein
MSSVFAVFEGVRGVFPGCRGRRWGVRSGLWGHGAVKTDGTPVPGPRVPLAPSLGRGHPRFRDPRYMWGVRVEQGTGVTPGRAGCAGATSCTGGM